MNELRNDSTLTTADIANPTRPEEGPSITRQNIAEASEQGNLQPSTSPQISGGPRGSGLSSQQMQPTPLFPDDELHNFRARWDQIQTSFVDEPRQAVEQADSLVANVVKRIAEQFAAEREQLEKQWDRGDSINTEDLRQALKRYRSFFDRLLTF